MNNATVTETTRIKIDSIIPFKNIADGEILSCFNLSFDIIHRYLSIQKYSLSLLSLEAITINSAFHENIFKDNFIDRHLESLGSFNVKQVCPFCGSFLFNDNGHNYCLNMNCIDIKQFVNSTYDKFVKLLPSLNEMEFQVLLKRFMEICHTFGKAEFNVILLFNAINSDVESMMVHPEFKYLYKRVYERILYKFDLTTFFRLCGFPDKYEDELIMFANTMNNNLYNYINLMRTSGFELNLSWNTQNKISEYLKITYMLNQDFLNFMQT